MKSVQTYRKNSADWIGFEIEIIKGKRYYVKDNIKIRIQAWQPDISYDQMFMIINKLQEEGTMVFLFCEDGCFVRIAKDRDTVENEHENLRTAFRLACTEFKTAK